MRAFLTEKYLNKLGYLISALKKQVSSMRKNNEKMDRLESSNGLYNLLGKGIKQRDNSTAFQKKAGRIANCFENIHPIQ